MAETIVDKIVKIHKFKHASECVTKELSISGAKGLNSFNFKDYVANKSRTGIELGIPFDEAKKLVERYGTNVDEVFQYAKSVNTSEITIPLSLYAELLYSIYYEMAMTPSDFFIRRTGYLFFNIELVEQYREQIIEIMSNIIGYSDSEKVFYKMQLEQYIEDAKNPMK